jgi:hypothetical protein
VTSSRCHFRFVRLLESSWNVTAHGDARERKWRGNWRMQWVASTLHTTSEHGVSSIITADAHTSAASSRLNWRPRRFKWTRPFRRKTKSGFCAPTITFQLLRRPIRISVRWLTTVADVFRGSPLFLPSAWGRQVYLIGSPRNRLSGRMKCAVKIFSPLYGMNEWSKAPLFNYFGTTYMWVFNRMPLPLFLLEGCMDTRVGPEDSEKRKILRTYQDSNPGPSSP